MGTETAVVLCQCDCNFHSEQCRFSNSHYLESKRKSGGFCENCKHNTTGRKCHLCAEGFHRDWTKPLSHSNVCKACECNPTGTLNGTTCNAATGQCQCKMGVTGPSCNRCLDGYVKSLLPDQPCIRGNYSSALC
ncbi:Netrin-1 [Cichlidogyrus casuarinus]|uniref:Netrin-1 n=1 Tax=Cichlidogyrus casuarinus TaxID=1844966 RepID=A0ABD2Q4N8_9PLAT